MRASCSARTLRSPFPPGGIAHPLDREELTLSLVELEPINDDEDDDVVASCARLSQICPVDDNLEELEVEVVEDTAWADDIWVDVSELNATADAPTLWQGKPNPFLVEEPSTFASARAAADDPEEWLEPLEDEEPELEILPEVPESMEILVPWAVESCAADTLDPPTVDIDWLLDDEQCNPLDPPTVDIDWLLDDEQCSAPDVPPARPTQRSISDAPTRVLRRSWICMPPGNTNSDLTDPTGLTMDQLLQLVRSRAQASHSPEMRPPMPSLPRFPILPPDPRTAPVHIPALRLPRFEVE